jgi:hypothetical protein
MKICQENENLVKIGQKYTATDMEKSLIPNSTEKCPVGAMLIYVNRQTEITKIIGAFATTQMNLNIQ